MKYSHEVRVEGRSKGGLNSSTSWSMKQGVGSSSRWCLKTRGLESSIGWNLIYRELVLPQVGAWKQEYWIHLQVGAWSTGSWCLENRGLLSPWVGSQKKRDLCLLQTVTCKWNITFIIVTFKIQSYVHSYWYIVIN